ncbi:hypothetical protein PCC6311_0871 [Synechococcus elongatus PCC 6311]|nr:hypothetical protein M744_12585 [Synechococcus elongatus UTEX 2973]UOW70632.1 hypothetical protein PCC7943_0871 [Synechococcus elongatus PCC 7943]UOW73353.1 hypothetical protein PCC6311_0871 [Synechococcus elongatus PCC 6311]UOW76073.1 hypothetical protein PCC6301pg_0871 [Synechococcus elongatus PCC 6301]
MTLNFYVFSIKIFSLDFEAILLLLSDFKSSINDDVVVLMMLLEINNLNFTGFAFSFGCEELPSIKH